METVGRLTTHSSKTFDVQWMISDFFSLPQKDGECYRSPLFFFAGAFWCLAIYPYGNKKYDSVGYISIFLRRKSYGLPINLEICLDLKSWDENIIKRSHFSHNYEMEEEGVGFGSFLLRGDLLERELKPDTLIVFCSLKYTGSLKILSSTLTANCSHCKEIVNAENLSSHEKKCVDRPIKCPECSDVIALKNWYEHECMTAIVRADKITETSGNDPVNKILQDFKQLFLKRENYDVVLRVKGKEFLVHKAILTARSPVFASTFQHNMKEKATGIVDIDDCDPSVFSDFLCFLYCREMDNFSEENVYSLYIVADKYHVPDLKIKCIDFIKANLSIETFCDAHRLALQFSEIDLTQLTTDFFIENAKKINTTVDWQTFVKEYPVQSNELFAKFMASLK